VIAQIVSAAGRRFHAGAGSDARQEDLRHAAMAQVVVERRSQKRPPSLLAY
jgi:hypothetical protein